ncbi:MAG: hypothetical protein H5T72_06525 [Actinobacteria bacterium]|nr:hypothetical protein [Actinomycetota bacterium]
MRFRRCSICGVPRIIGRLNAWMPNGTVVNLSNRRYRQIFYEADLLPEIRRRISEGLGFPVNRIFYEAERNSVREVVEGLLNNPARMVFLRVLPLKRGAVHFFHQLAALTGTAHSRTLRYRPGRFGEAYIRNPWDLDLMAAVVVGAFEALEKKPYRAFWKKEGEGYILRVEATESKPEIADRLQVDYPPLKDGHFRHHLCPRCGVPLQLRHLEWREGEGVIVDRRRNTRMINWEAHSVRMVIRELVRELGEEVVPIIVDAERDRTLRMLRDLGLLGLPDEERGRLLQEMLSQLPVYGYGLASEVEYTSGGILRVWVDNPYEELLMAGRLGAFYEAVEGRRARIDWSQAGPSTVSYILSPEKPSAGGEGA